MYKLPLGPSVNVNMPQKLKVSVVQACTAAYSLDNTLEKLDRLVRLAKERDNAQLCVFPEAL